MEMVRLRPAVEVQVGDFIELEKASVVHRYVDDGVIVFSLDNDTRLHVEEGELLLFHAAA